MYFQNSIMLINLLLLCVCYYGGNCLAYPDECVDSCDRIHQCTKPDLTPYTPHAQLFHIDDKSYYLGKNVQATFSEAIQYCELMNMRLATIRSERESIQIYQHLTDIGLAYEHNFWVSGSDMADGKTWIWMTTGQHIEYFNWFKGQPSGGNQYCLDVFYRKDIGKMLWYDEECETRYSFICEKPRLTCDNCESSSVNRCNPHNGSIPIIEKEGMTYYLETTQKVTKYRAAEICEENNMKLAVIHNDEENAILRRMLPYYGRLNDQIWIAAEKAKESSPWMWGPDEPVTFKFKWYKEQPAKLGFPKCVSIHPYSGADWEKTPCVAKRNFLCQCPR